MKAGGPSAGSPGSPKYTKAEALEDRRRLYVAASSMNRSWGCWRSTRWLTPSAVSPVWSSSGYPRFPSAGSRDSIARTPIRPRPRSRDAWAIPMFGEQSFALSPPSQA
jgi:hypothetical protein